MCSAQRSKMPRGFCIFPIFSSILKTKPKIYYIYTRIYNIISFVKSTMMTHHAPEISRSDYISFFDFDTLHKHLKLSDPVTHTHISQQLLYTRNPHVTHHHQHHTIPTVYTCRARKHNINNALTKT